MNTATRLAIFLVVAGLAAGMFSPTGVAIADKPEEDDPDRNLWGKEASELAHEDEEEGGENEQGSEMGEHSRDPAGGDARPGPGRLGIGNLPGHPSESIELLCGEGGQNCPEAIAD